MTRNNKTRHALLMSLMSILLCIAMLIGSTFAWFTDTASTNVNKIEAGTLDIKLEYANNVTGVDANWNEIKDGSSPLGWMQKTSPDGVVTMVTESGKPLWEPGVTFSLPALKISNAGSLDLKYKIVISGITGNAKLLDVITWTMKIGEDTVPLDTEHNLSAKAENIFTISGKMDSAAGNEYQGLSIDGIAVTVYATQLTSEYDSISNDYDAAALYDLKINEKATADLPITVSSNVATVKTATTISSGSVSVEYPESVKLSASASDGDSTQTVTQKLEYSSATPTSGIEINAEAQVAASYELTLPVAQDNDVLVPVTLNYEKGLTGVVVYHSGTQLGTSEGNKNTNGEYFTYSSETGKLVMYLKHASKIDIVFDNPSTVTVTTEAELKDALDDASVKTIRLGNDISFSKVWGLEHSVTIDFCGKTLSATPKYDFIFAVYKNNKLTFKDSVGAAGGTAGTFTSTDGGGVKLYDDKAQFELNDITMRCSKGTVIDVYSPSANTAIAMNSGKIVATGSATAIQSGGDGAGHTVTINGGTIECNNNGNVGIYLDDNCTLTVNNCNYSKDGNLPFRFGTISKVSGGNRSTVIINNITFTATNVTTPSSRAVTINDIFADKSENATLTINDGTFSVNGTTLSDITKT